MSPSHVKTFVISSAWLFTSQHLTRRELARFLVRDSKKVLYLVKHNKVCDHSRPIMLVYGAFETWSVPS